MCPSKKWLVSSFFLASYLLFWPFSAFSGPLDTTNIYQKLSILHQTGQFKELYRQALRFQAALEGEPDFDYYYGVSAIDTGHLSEGIFALERVQQSGEPSLYFNQFLVQVELARGYFLLGDNVKAELLFNETLLAKPPQPVMDKIQIYLKKIADRKNNYQPFFSAYIEQSIGHDDNVNALPNEIVRFFGVFASDLSGESDTYGETKLGASYRHPITRNNALFVDVDYFLRNNSNVDSMDNDGFNLNAGTTFQAEKAKFRASYYHQNYDLDGDSYRKMDGFLGEYLYSVSNTTVLTGNLSLVKFDYEDNAPLDSFEMIYRIGAMHQFQGNLQPLGYFQVYLGKTDDDEENALSKAITARDFTGISVGVQLKLSDDMTIGTNYLYQDSDYDNLHPYFSAIRNDDLELINVDFVWDIKARWKLLARVSHIDNDSSLTLYKYRKTYGQIGVRYEF